MDQVQVQVQVQAQAQVQVQSTPLKCPRCDSSNTKFCYYNNYSLSQPRHLCKACKRYWTRGGTLRNVPIGGGCRKNKSSITNKKSSSSPFAPLMTSSFAKPSITTKTHINNNIPNDLNPLYYDMSLPIFNTSGVGVGVGVGGGELGFCSTHVVTSQNFGSGNATNIVTTSSNTLLLSSYPEQENLISNGFKDITQYQTIPYGGFLGLDEVEILHEKMEGNGNRLDWNYDENYIESIDPTFMWNSGGGVWHHDSSSTNIINGSSSSVPSLI